MKVFARWRTRSQQSVTSGTNSDRPVMSILATGVLRLWQAGEVGVRSNSSFLSGSACAPTHPLDGRSGATRSTKQQSPRNGTARPASRFRWCQVPRREFRTGGQQKLCPSSPADARSPR